MTIELVIAQAHIQALSQAATKSQLSLRAYVSEIVESFAASLILPDVTPSGGKAGGIVESGLVKGEGEPCHFPFPAQTYKVALNRHF
jgi:hypothetical protein